MKECFPLKEVSGLDSELYGHFYSSPVFILVDTETKEIWAMNNSGQNHAKGICNPRLYAAS